MATALSRQWGRNLLRLGAFCTACRAMGQRTVRVETGDSYGGEGLHLHVSQPYRKVIIFLHGLGDTAGGWMPVFQDFVSSDPSLFAETKIVLPTAPKSAVSLFAGAEAPAWFDLAHTDENGTEDDVGMERARQRILRIIEAERSKGIPTNNIVLGGFSQGAAMSYYTTVRANFRLAGVILLSGWLPLRRTLAENMTPEAKLSPMFACHGRNDDVIPIGWGRRSAEIAQAAGMSLKFKEYRMGHFSCPEEMSDVLNFISSLPAFAEAAKDREL